MKKDFLPEYGLLYTDVSLNQDIHIWFLCEDSRENWVLSNISNISHIERIYRPIERKQRLVSTISISAYEQAYSLKKQYSFKTISETIEYLITKAYSKQPIGKQQ